MEKSFLELSDANHKRHQEIRELEAKLASAFEIAVKEKAWSMFVEDELDAIPQEKNYVEYQDRYEAEAKKQLKADHPRSVQ